MSLFFMLKLVPVAWRKIYVLSIIKNCEKQCLEEADCSTIRCADDAKLRGAIKCRHVVQINLDRLNECTERDPRKCSKYFCMGHQCKFIELNEATICVQNLSILYSDTWFSYQFHDKVFRAAHLGFFLLGCGNPQKRPAELLSFFRTATLH